MYDDLKQVIEGASRILEKTLSRRTRPIKNFVLVPFHDPGVVVGEDQGLKELLNIHNSALIVSLKFPRPGAWKLKVSCSGRHMLRVTGVSNLDFRAGFSSVPVSEFSSTRERPIKGIPAHVLLKCTGLQPPGQLSHVELMSGSGRSLRTLPVRRSPPPWAGRVCGVSPSSAPPPRASSSG
ncbi:hemicentin-1-like [Cynoglossus semilaevis]|uniref:hemicentin-1-like n=1 Tax=Cynoglossus semilaevis TaxID=244447 RepID=UPI000D630E8E|nr:hemicentin-1-like [Cynoglossus semilaevis]